VGEVSLAHAWYGAEVVACLVGAGVIARAESDHACERWRRYRSCPWEGLSEAARILPTA